MSDTPTETPCTKFRVQHGTAQAFVVEAADQLEAIHKYREQHKGAVLTGPLSVAGVAGDAEPGPVE